MGAARSLLLRMSGLDGKTAHPASRLTRSTTKETFEVSGLSVKLVGERWFVGPARHRRRVRVQEIWKVLPAVAM